MSVLSGALGHVLWDDGEAAEPAKLFPVRVTAVDEITATFDCEHLAYRGSSSKGLPFDRFILEDPDGYVGVGSTSQVQPAVSGRFAVHRCNRLARRYSGRVCRARKWCSRR